MAFALSFLKSQLLTWLPYPNDDFSGQTIIVTGANTGLGLEAARHLVRLNAEKVIIACRTTSKGEAAKLNILQTTKAKKDVVEVWQLDLSDYDSIRAFAKKVQTLKRLDAFIQNAGIMTRKWAMVQGVESTISVNVISGVLCALMVLPKLRETGKTYGTKTRLSFVGSDLQAVAKFVEADTNGSLLDSLNVQKEDLADRCVPGCADRYMLLC
jgi:NAD(P)-dependent dehydrogenase (short-subunit alcohol dehydrogenase family)